ncbi:MAG TPA: precorrin-6y C5,15-methyltransferase (decarboxylating) subunit CbiE [Dehalococcoidia bacterium]|nr:precorrin-6y C5,15-methyltransferase (decarboxylating) subunit CbiE [Dehalococcoidia bacterium]
MKPIHVVGVGPGDPEFLTLKALRLLQEADLVAGFSTVLAVVRPHIRGETVVLTYRDQEEGLARLGQAAREGKRCVVCAWGDPSVSAAELVGRVRRAHPCVEVVPGVSSLAVACARVGVPLEESLFVSLHRREGGEDALDELVEALALGRRHLFAFPRPYDLMPAEMARRLLAKGLQGDRPVLVLERLTLEGERLVALSLGELAQRDDFSDLTVLFFPRPDREGIHGKGTD